MYVFMGDFSMNFRHGYPLYIQKGVVIQFHIKKFVHMGWTNQKARPKTKKQIMHI